MKKPKLFFLLLFSLMLSVTAWADGLHVSESTDTPEYIYKIHGGKQDQTKYWGNIGQPVDAASAAEFAFYESTTDGQYYIYDIKNKKYLSYSNASFSSSRDQVSSTENKEGDKDNNIGTLWKISTTTSGSATYYLMQPILSTGDVSDVYANWYGGIGYFTMTAMGWFNSSTDGGSAWAFEIAGGTKAVTVTYDVRLAGSSTTLYTTKVVSAEGNSYPTPTLPSTTYCSSSFYSFSVPSGTVAAADETVVVTLNQNMPFKISKSFDDAVWYTLGISADNKKWYYTAGETQMKPSETSPTVEAKYMFCFVGDIVNGFKIYNKLAGDNMLLSSSKDLSSNAGNNTYATLVETTTAETQCYLWDIINKSEATKTISFDGFLIAQHGNSSARMNLANSSLAFWTAGSGPNSGITAEKVLDTEEVQNICTKAGSAGFPAADNAAVTALKEAFDNFKTEGSAENLTTLLAAITTYEACTDVVLPQANKFYTLQETTEGRYILSTLSTVDSYTTRLATSKSGTADNVADRIFYYDGSNMMGYNNGYFVSTTGGTNGGFPNQAAVSATAGTAFSFATAKVSEGSLYVNFYSNARGLYGLRDGYVDAGGASTNQDGYRFFVTEVTELPLTIGTNGWSTFSAPVAVNVPDDENVKVYYAPKDPENGKLGLEELTGGVIPAKTGVIVQGSQGTTVTFGTNVTGAAESLSANKLVCNWNVNKLSGTSSDGIYAFATKKDKNITGFMKLLTDITLPGHKCYLNTTTSAGSAQFLPITLTDDPTGIESAETTTVGDSDAPIYDLQGRKVNGTKKGGMYIQNGKVFIAM